MAELFLFALVLLLCFLCRAHLFSHLTRPHAGNGRLLFADPLWYKLILTMRRFISADSDRGKIQCNNVLVWFVRLACDSFMQLILLARHSRMQNPLHHEISPKIFMPHLWTGEKLDLTLVSSLLLYLRIFAFPQQYTRHWSPAFYAWP